MSRYDRDQVQFRIEAESEPEAQVTDDETPFRIALIGDWSCGANRTGLASRRPIQVDRDNYDAVLKRLAPAIQTPAGQISITELDHFHPDALFGRMPIFDALRNQRADVL